MATGVAKITLCLSTGMEITNSDAMEVKYRNGALKWSSIPCKVENVLVFGKLRFIFLLENVSVLIVWIHSGKNSMLGEH